MHYKCVNNVLNCVICVHNVLRCIIETGFYRKCYQSFSFFLLHLMEWLQNGRLVSIMVQCSKKIKKKDNTDSKTTLNMILISLSTFSTLSSFQCMCGMLLLWPILRIEMGWKLILSCIEILKNIHNNLFMVNFNYWDNRRLRWREIISHGRPEKAVS